MEKKLEGKVALVTGGGQEIGKAICLRLSEEGAKVVVFEINPETGPQMASRINSNGGEALAVAGDVSKAEDVRKAVNEALHYFGNIDILVNNAGVHKRTPCLDISEEEWDWIQAVNLKGPFLTSRLLGRYWVEGKKKGKIVNIASMVAQVAIANQAHYCASKAGVFMLTRAMALELAPYGININAIGPGPIKTAITRDRLEDPVQSVWLIDNIPLGRIGMPVDIANAVIFLAGPESDFITGHMLIVDGGWVIK